MQVIRQKNVHKLCTHFVSSENVYTLSGERVHTLYCREPAPTPPRRNPRRNPPRPCGRRGCLRPAARGVASGCRPPVPVA